MSSRIELPRDKLLVLAKQHLIRATNTPSVPEGYLDELRKHVKFAKDDIKFLLYPEPGRGYGIVQCLEVGCGDTLIKLSKRAGADDGKREGIGSLSAYRLHVQEHPTHKINRFERVKAESKGLSNSQSSHTSNPSGPSKSGSTSFGRPGPSIKPEPYDSSVGSSSPASSMIRSGAKRNFPFADDEDTDITIPSSSPFRPSSMASKKAKLEGVKPETSLAPLGTVDPNAPKPAAAGAALPFPSKHAAQAKLDTTNDMITVTQNLLALYSKKKRKSTYDKMRLGVIGAELRDLLAEKARCEAFLRSNSSVVAPPVASGSNVQLPATASSMGELPSVLSGIKPEVPDTGIANYGDVALPNYGDPDYDDIYGRRRHISYRGPVANPGDIEKFLVDAGNSELFDGNESVDKALEKIGLTKLGEQIPNMTIALMPHQVIGVAWMNEHERGSHKGGILADEMGLGKTVQMIATMIQNRSDDPAVKSTLICAPVALLEQWKLEIETKTEGAFKCLIYHGANKPKQKAELQKYDVVLTTFQTLALEYDDPRVEEKKKNKKKKGKGNSSDDFIESDSEDEKKKKLDKKTKGLLLRVPWLRLVLDEAQNIRNRNTRISIAVTNIEAKYRWCLTGTPVTNSLADCYGLIRFLGIRPWCDWQDFNGHIARIEKKNPELASRRLQAILNSCLLRRKKDSLLDGKKLIELPPKEVVLQQLVFSEEERDIYNSVEAKSQAKFNRYLRAGTVLKNYSQVLVLLLRLRQLCSHPCLIQEDGYAFVRPEDEALVKHEVQTELDRARILAGDDFVKRMKAKLKEVVLQRMAAEKESAEAMIEEECPICFDSLTDPLLTRCGHVFCADCIDTVLNQPPVEDGNQPHLSMSERPCPTCRAPVQKEMLFQRSAFEPTDADLGDSGASSSTPIVVDEDDDDDGLPIGSDVFEPKKSNASSTSKGKGKAKAKKRFSKKFLVSDDEDEDEDDDMSDFIVESDEDEEEKDARRELKKKLGKNKRVVPDEDEDEDEDIEMEDSEELLPPKVVAKKKGKAKNLERFLPSTKMKEMMVLLKQWAEDNETRNEKTMVLSQWTSCLDLVAHYLDENGFTYVRYQGNMNRNSRDEAVRTFMSQGKARIMLMSLKCGGVGLNLTRANRVISLDLGWSSAVESQAFDRVHRLGQVRPVTVQRLVIENTVEARILALQERKQNLADGSLGEGTGKKLGRLSVKDLANLFGLNARGEVL